MKDYNKLGGFLALVKSMLGGLVNRQGLADIGELVRSRRTSRSPLRHSKLLMTDTVKLRGNPKTVRSTRVFGSEIVKAVEDTSGAGIKAFGKLQCIMPQKILQKEALSDTDTTGDHLFGANLFKNLQKDQCSNPYGIESPLLEIELF